MTTEITTSETKRQSLVARFAEKYHIEPARMLETLKATAFRQRGEALPHPFLMDAQGRPTTDPTALPPVISTPDSVRFSTEPESRPKSPTSGEEGRLM